MIDRLKLAKGIFLMILGFIVFAVLAVRWVATQASHAAIPFIWEGLISILFMILGIFLISWGIGIIVT